VLATNAGLTVITRQTGVMGNTKLKVTDADDPATRLVYSVVTSPTQGALSLGTTFTQYDIDNGQLKYTHTGSAPGSDSFTFTVTDGKESIGPFTFNITIANAAPILAANAGRVLTHQGILSHVWNPAVADHTEYLRVYLRQLRRKIEDDPDQPQILVTEPGIGYRFVLEG
jgi:VCBS repeat-containing protein